MESKIRLKKEIADLLNGQKKFWLRLYFHTSETNKPRFYKRLRNDRDLVICGADKETCDQFINLRNAFK